MGGHRIYNEGLPRGVRAFADPLHEDQHTEGLFGLHATVHRHIDEVALNGQIRHHRRMEECARGVWVNMGFVSGFGQLLEHLANLDETIGNQILCRLLLLSLHLASWSGVGIVL